MSAVRNDDEMVWHNDGHVLLLSLNKSELEILQTSCPHDDDDDEGDCHSDIGCIVNYFVNRFGLDCNIGVCAPEPTLEICWALSGDKRDPEAAQLWFVPNNDDVFYAWLSTRELEPDASDEDQQP